MFGKIAFLHSSFCAKSDGKILMSTPSKVKCCNFESFKQAQDEILTTNESVLAITFVFIALLSQSIKNVNFAKVNTLEFPAF